MQLSDTDVHQPIACQGVDIVNMMMKMCVNDEGGPRHKQYSKIVKNNLYSRANVFGVQR